MQWRTSAKVVVVCACNSLEVTTDKTDIDANEWCTSKQECFIGLELKSVNLIRSCLVKREGTRNGPLLVLDIFWKTDIVQGQIFSTFSNQMEADVILQLCLAARPVLNWLGNIIGIFPTFIWGTFSHVTTSRRLATVFLATRPVLKIGKCNSDILPIFIWGTFKDWRQETGNSFHHLTKSYTSQPLVNKMRVILLI